MGYGSWDSRSFDVYTTTTKGMSSTAYATSCSLNTQDIYKSTSLAERLNPKNVMRECRDSEEHPNSLPVILALDVTGSMGQAAVKVAQKLNEIMTDLYDNEAVKDIQFCIMGIGDLDCDRTPIQISQFESDIRIAEQMDEVYFEFGGGGNLYESYTAAWYMGVRHCDLDCWKRNKKGIIITLGDELPNPYLPKISRRCGGLEEVTGDNLQDSIETKDLILETKEKYDIYHISVDDTDSAYSWNNRANKVDDAWKELLGEENYFVVNLNSLAKTISEIIVNRENNTVVNNNEVSW